MTRTTSHLLRTGRRTLVASAIAVAAFGVGAAISPALGLTKAPLTFGRIPLNALTPAGIRWSVVPDYVAVVSHGHVVGYVAKYAIDETSPRIGPLNGGTYTPRRDVDLTVVNRALEVVGRMVPMVGFVPLGQSLLTTPTGVTPTTVYGVTPTTAYGVTTTTVDAGSGG